MQNSLGRISFAFFWLSCIPLVGQTSVLTQHNDLARTGQNLSETLLTPHNVNSVTFGKLFNLTVDGMVEAQPLYVSGVTINGATHNVVLIATEHDTVFAFDADSGGSPLWQASLLDAQHGAASGATPVPQAQNGCHITNGEFGISGTPVIDPTTATLYVVSNTLESNSSIARLHALDITTGLEKFGKSTVIQAALPSTGTGSLNGTLTFDANVQNQRPGLALIDGKVYIAFASYCDLGNYHGWLFAYDASSLTQTAAFLTTPHGAESGIWMGAAAPSADTQNGVTRMFITTGNGVYDATVPYAANSMDYGDDILRLDLTNGINVNDSFTPFDQGYLQTSDRDLGSSGALILPDQPGPHPHLLLLGSKNGVLYLVDRDNLGGYSTTGNNVVQELDNQVGPSYGLPAYWNGNVYLWSDSSRLQQFTLANGVLSSTPVAVSPQVQASGLGSTPSISANGTSNGIVWSIDYSFLTQVLYAHDATNVANLLWSSATNATRDSAGPSSKFHSPTIANGKVYVGSVGQVSVYGLLTGAQTITFTTIPVQTAGTTLPLTAAASSGLPVSYVSSTPGVCTISGTTATFVAAGTCSITASQSGNASYTAAAPVSQTFNVQAAATNGPAPYVGYVAFWGINNSGVTVSWSTDVPANTVLAYGTTLALGQFSPVQTALTNSHGVVLTGLLSGTTYYFVAQSTGTNGSTGHSSTYSFQTTGVASAAAPVISNVTQMNVTSSSATITWVTDQGSTSQVNYGTTSSYGSSSALDTNPVSNHSVTLTNLLAGTVYDFQVVSTTSSGALSASSGNHSFATTNTVVTAPALSNIKAGPVTSSSVTITWSTDQAASSLVDYGTTPAYGSSSPLSPALVTTHSVTLTGLAASTTYNFAVVSANATNLSSSSSNFTVTTAAAASGMAPNVSYVAFWGVTGSGVTISWSTDVPATSAVAYGTTASLGQTSPLQTTLTTSHGITLTGLSGGTTYYFVAQSADGNGNTGHSTTYSFTTLSWGPPTISAINVTPSSGNTASITWTTSSPGYSYVQFGTTTSYGRYSAQSSLTTNPQCNLGYVPSGLIHYQLVSADANGNQTLSPDYTFTEP